MHPLSLKGVGHILTFKPQWLLRELTNLTLKIMRSAHTMYLLFCTNLRTTANIFHYSSCWLAFITETEYLLSGENWIFKSS
jgi:hypothetical protein